MVRIPAEYQEVEYIESPGLCYFDIIVPTNNSTVSSDIVFQPLTGGFKNNYWFAGDGRMYTIQHEYGMFGGRWYNNGSSATYIGNYSDVVHAYYHEYQRSGSNNIIWRMFGRYGFDPSQISNTPPCRIWSCYLVVDDEKAFALIPCYRKSDNEIGMYDTVSGTFYTNQGTGTFLKGNDVTYDPISLLETRRRILLNTPHIESASGNIVTFNTDLSANLPDMKIHFHPVQEGTGDPSPDNVRPIRGWDGIDVYIGRNILDGMTLNYRNGNIIYPYNYGSVTVYSKTGSACTDWIDCSQYRGQTLTLNHAPEPGSAGWCFYSATNMSDYVTGFYSRDDLSVVEGGLWTITVPDGDNINYMRFSTHPDYLDDVQILLNMETTTISFPQTIYGGYVDLIKGEIVETYYYDTLTTSVEDLSSQYNSDTGIFFRCEASHIMDPSDFTKNITDLKCDILKYVVLTIWGNPDNHINETTRRYRSNTKICMNMEKSLIGINNEDSLSDQKATLDNYLEENPIHIVYKLATPIIHSINPQTLKALKGTNNIFSDANGNIEIKFWKH